MVKLRFQRKGRTHRPFYRLAAVDSRFKGNGKFIELLGWFNPMAAEHEKTYEFKEDRIKHWLSVGAQPSDTVADMLAKDDLLTPKLKAKWEADRERARKRVSAKVSVEKAEAAVAAIAELAGDSDADLSSFTAAASGALKDAQAAASSGDVPKAEAARATAEQAIADAKKADDDDKAAKAAAEAKAAEEAAAAEAAAAEASEGDGAEEEKPEEG